MPNISKQRVNELIEKHMQGYQDILEGRIHHIRQKFDDDTRRHMLWTLCSTLLDFMHLRLITYEEFGHLMYRLDEMVKGKPELEKQVHNAIHLAAGNDPF